jgi:hypothetical protein
MRPLATGPLEIEGSDVAAGVLKTAEAQLLRNKKHSLLRLCCFKLASIALRTSNYYALHLPLNTAGECKIPRCTFASLRDALGRPQARKALSRVFPSVQT